MISKHISYTEATRSTTALRLGIDNKPSEDIICKMQNVAQNVFEPLREWYGKPIRVNSFYRCLELNKAIGGSRNSAHTRGESIDIDTQNDNKELFDYIKNNLEFDKLIWEFGDDSNPDWVHVSYVEGSNRGIILKAYRENGQTKYSEWNK